MTYKNLIELKEQRPQLYKRLVNWGLQRRTVWGFPNVDIYKKHLSNVENEIETYLDDLVFTPTEFHQAYCNLAKWDKVLTDKEKQAVGLLFPFELPHETYKEKNKLQRLIDLGKHTLSWVGIKIPDEVTLINNWYDGLYKVLDERVIDKITYGSEDIGLITENSYEAVIFNTDSMLIIDIDINNFDSIVKYPEQAISALHVLEEKDNINFRIYQTAGGLRAIETTKEWNPNSYRTKKLMQSVYADPLYVGLCQAQDCFRARLTPKPWRYNELNDSDYCGESGEEWMNSIESKVAVCKLITDGSKPIDDKFFAAIEYHDRVTKALTAEQDDLCLV